MRHSRLSCSPRRDSPARTSPGATASAATRSTGSPPAAPSRSSRSRVGRPPAGELRAGGLPPLVAVAHGSRDPQAATVIEELAGQVRRRAATRGLPGLPVAVAFVGHAAPSPGQVLAALPAGPVVVLPLLLTAAYHSKADIPALLRSAAARRIGTVGPSKPETSQPGTGPLEISYGVPLGPHPLLITALERRLAEVGVTPGDPGTSVVLAAAGSSDPQARAAVSALAAQWQARGGWRDVVPGYASAAAPTPAAAVSALRAGGARRVVVASYLLAPGRFAAQVRRDALAAGAAAVSGVLGAAPEVADVVLARYHAARCQTAPIRAEPAHDEPHRRDGAVVPATAV